MQLLVWMAGGLLTSRAIYPQSDIKLRRLNYIVVFFFVSLTGDIYDKVQEELSKRGLDTECLGGGRIVHDPEKKSILVFGYSQVRLLYAGRNSMDQAAPVCAPDGHEKEVASSPVDHKTSVV